MHQVGFYLHNYIEMQGQQNILKNVQQVSSLVTTEFPATYVTVITKGTIRVRNIIFHMIKKTLPRWVGHMKLVEGSQDWITFVAQILVFKMTGNEPIIEPDSKFNLPTLRIAFYINILTAGNPIGLACPTVQHVVNIMCLSSTECVIGRQGPRRVINCA